MPPIVLPGPADATPVDPSAAPALREEIKQAKAEITGMHQIAELLRSNQRVVVNEVHALKAEIGRAFDAQDDRWKRAIDDAIDRVRREIKDERKALRAEYDRQVAEWIEASERRSDAKIAVAVAAVAAADHRIDELSLKVGVHAEEVTGVTQVLVRRVDEHEGFISKYRQPIAASAGSTGLTLAVIHLAPLLWAWLKAKAGIS